MLHLDTTAIHMAKCVTRAYNIDYHLSVYTHCYSKFKDTFEKITDKFKKKKKKGQRNRHNTNKGNDFFSSLLLVIKSVFEYFFSDHGVELKNLWSKFTLKQKCIYYWRKIFIEWIYGVPLMRRLMNTLIFRMIDKMQSRFSSQK